MNLLGLIVHAFCVEEFFRLTIDSIDLCLCSQGAALARWVQVPLL